MPKWDHRWLKWQSIAVGLLWIIGMSGLLFKLAGARTIGEVFIYCLMFIAMIIGLGFIMIWYESRP